MITPAHRVGHRLGLAHDFAPIAHALDGMLMPLDQALRLRPAASTMPGGSLSSLDSVPDAEFRAMVDSLRFGRWRIAPELAALLWHCFDEDPPELVLEFGSGLSTLVLAHLMARRGAGGPCRVVTIEQSRRYLDKTRGLLEMFGLEEHVSLVHVPVSWLSVEGQKTWCYGLDKALLETPLAGRRADFIFIDGPASCRRYGRPRSRFGTLPLARRFATDSARFLLDDALRDAELAVVRQWRALPYVEIDGVIPVGNGVLAGRIRRGPPELKLLD
jgi:hypothetical protein